MSEASPEKDLYTKKTRGKFRYLRVFVRVFAYISCVIVIWDYVIWGYLLPPDKQVEQKIDYFHKNLAKLMNEQESAIIEASQLTDFHWHTAIFYDNSFFIRTENYHVRFKRNYMSSIYIDLNKSDYWIEEYYAAGSPVDKHISADRQLLIDKTPFGIRFRIAEDYMEVVFFRSIDRLMREKKSFVTTARYLLDLSRSSVTFPKYTAWEKLCFDNNATDLADTYVLMALIGNVWVKFHVDPDRYIFSDDDAIKSLIGKCVNEYTKILIKRMPTEAKKRKMFNISLF